VGQVPRDVEKLLKEQAETCKTLIEEMYGRIQQDIKQVERNQGKELHQMKIAVKAHADDTTKVAASLEDVLIILGKREQQMEDMLRKMKRIQKLDERLRAFMLLVTSEDLEGNEDKHG